MAGGALEMQPGDALDNVVKLSNAVFKGVSAAWFLGAARKILFPQ